MVPWVVAGPAGRVSLSVLGSSSRAAMMPGVSSVRVAQVVIWSVSLLYKARMSNAASSGQWRPGPWAGAPVDARRYVCEVPDASPAHCAAVAVQVPRWTVGDQ